MTTPKPELLLEMTPQDTELIGIFKNEYLIDDPYGIKKSILATLLRVEAGRREADWERQAARQGLDCKKLPQGDWTPADWLALVEREIKGE